jgi:hypothetical protein
VSVPILVPLKFPLNLLYYSSTSYIPGPALIIGGKNIFFK